MTPEEQSFINATNQAGYAAWLAANPLTSTVLANDEPAFRALVVGQWVGAAPSVWASIQPSFQAMTAPPNDLGVGGGPRADLDFRYEAALAMYNLHVNDPYQPMSPDQQAGSTLQGYQNLISARIDNDIATHQSADYGPLTLNNFPAHYDGQPSSPFTGTVYLQADPQSILNWNTVFAQCVAAINAGNPNQIVPLRSKSNLNIDCAAQIGIDFLTDIFQRNSQTRLTGAAAKTAVRAATSTADIDTIYANISWPPASGVT